MAKNDLQGPFDLLVLKTPSQLNSRREYGVIIDTRRVPGHGWKAKCYAPTRAGEERLARREKNWEQVAKGVQAILRFA